MRTKKKGYKGVRQILIRVDDALYDRILKEAIAEKRSMSAQVALVVERAMGLERESAEAAR